MPQSKLVGLLFETWEDMDRGFAGLDPAEAVHQVDGGSSYAWTLARATNQVAAYINVRFQQRTSHALIDQDRFRFGGTGVADDWQAIQLGVEEVRAAARRFLQGMDDPGLDIVVPYDGSLVYLRERGLSLRYVLFRIITHHYYHIGEIATKRDLRGQSVGDYLGMLELRI